jgi:hypothetical protein
VPEVGLEPDFSPCKFWELQKTSPIRAHPADVWAYFNEPTGWERKDVGTIMGDEKGSYRARLHATGRDTAFDEVVESPVERHLVQFWKEPPSPVSVLSSDSKQGKDLPRFITMWQGQGPGTATAHAGPATITNEARQEQRKLTPGSSGS